MNETKQNKKNLSNQVAINIKGFVELDDKELSKFSSDLTISEVKNEMTSQLEKLTYDTLFVSVLKIVNSCIKGINKIDFNHVFKKSVIGRVFDVPIYIDSPGVDLFRNLYFLKGYYEQILPLMMQKIDELVLKFSSNIQNVNFENSTSFDKTIILSQLNALRNLKMNYVLLNNCASTILNNPDVISFYSKWEKLMEITMKRNGIAI